MEKCILSTCLILKNILHEYAAFEVITLDSFTNKIIRNFSRELNLPSSYELIIESKQTFQDITNRILEKVGTDKSLTKLLVSFSLSKVENFKSWDIAFDINEFFCDEFFCDVLRNEPFLKVFYESDVYLQQVPL